jgi:hypothetical protein
VSDAFHTMFIHCRQGIGPLVADKTAVCISPFGKRSTGEQLSGVLLFKVDIIP